MTLITGKSPRLVPCQFKQFISWAGAHVLSKRDREDKIMTRIIFQIKFIYVCLYLIRLLLRNLLSNVFVKILPEDRLEVS